MITKILMVCLGNICRSPLAEGILQNKVDPKQVYIDSAGTGGFHIGNPPDARSIAVAKKNGIDISHQRCRKFDTQDFNDFDRIYVMDKSNYRNVIALAKNEADAAKVTLLLSEVDLALKEVPDPYYDALEGFDHVFRLIDSACEAIVEKL